MALRKLMIPTTQRRLLPTNAWSLPPPPPLGSPQPGLRGDFAAAGALPALARLDLSAKSLRGAVPAALGALARLEFLDLSMNALAGAVPAALAGASALRFLNLLNNAPQEIRPCPGVRSRRSGRAPESGRAMEVRPRPQPPTPPPSLGPPGSRLQPYLLP